MEQSLDFESCVLGAIAKGLLEPSALDARGLSKPGRIVLDALGRFEPGHERSPEAIIAMAVEGLGQSGDEIRPLAESMFRAGADISGTELLVMARRKMALATLLDKANEQLATGKMDLAALADYAAGCEDPSADLVPMSETLGAFEAMPEGPHIKSLPILCKLTGGVNGLWVAGGMAGVGKTTLTMQMAIELSQAMPVLYYDIENLANDMAARINQIFRGNAEAARRHLGRLYLRPNFDTLAADVAAIPPPALIVVDSIQTLPTTTKDRRVALEGWIRRLQRLTKQGYTVLAVSEMSKASFKELTEDGARQGHFKETATLDYAATVGLNLIEDPDRMRLVHVHIVKNRNRPFRGRACTIFPDKQRGSWWFDEDPAQR